MSNWLMSLKYGELRSYFHLCRRRNLIALDYWSDNESPGCLSKFKSQKDFYKQWGTLSSGQKNSLWSFYDLMKKGDVVFIRDKIDNKPAICAKCIVISDYKYNDKLLYNEDEWDKNYESWGHYRDVEFLPFTPREKSTKKYRSTLHKLSDDALKLIIEENETDKGAGEVVRLPPEIDESLPLPEGSILKRYLNSYERNPQVRKECIDYYGYQCQICGFDFETVYGPKGNEIIEVHHIVPLSKIKQGYQVNPVKDLLPVCPNCHTILHSKEGNEVFSPEEVKEMIVVPLFDFSRRDQS